MASTEMRGLTLTQPWATLVAIGAKRIETRSWRTAYRGEVAIHAAKNFPDEERALCWEPAFRAVLEQTTLVDYTPYSDMVPGDWELVSGFPLGAIVAVATLVTIDAADCPELRLSDQERAFGDFSAGRWAWALGGLRQLREPIPCKGALGLWPVPEDLQRRIREAGG